MGTGVAAMCGHEGEGGNIANKLRVPFVNGPQQDKVIIKTLSFYLSFYHYALCKIRSFLEISCVRVR